MSTQRDEISEARARKGHALYVEGDRRPFAVEAERAYQRRAKRRQRAAHRRAKIESDTT